MATLTSLLARDGVVALDVIEQALQRQVLEGGELDTAVLELTSVPENLLAAYRAASYGLLPALREDLARADRALAPALPATLALEHRVVPIAHEGELLVLAAPWPLTQDVLLEIAAHVQQEPALRVGTELRTQEAIARCYGEELPSRFKRLAERLERQDPGHAVEVAPPAQHSEPPKRPKRRAAERPARLSRSPSPKGAFEAVTPPDAPAQPTVVRVVPMVRLGGPLRPAFTRSVEGERGETEPHLSRPASSSRHSVPRGGRISGAPRGPLTQAQAMELLGRAQDRDRVLDAFFSFARQYFSCAVLFALREDRLLGLEASGLPELEVRSLDLPVTRKGSVQSVVLERSARVLDLTAAPADQALAAALGRAETQPCAVIPIAIRQRIVAVLYGDRGGEALVLGELGDLLQTLPAVSTAFERIIQVHKLQAVAARDESAHAPPGRSAGPRPARPPSAKPTSVGAVPQRSRTATDVSAPSRRDVARDSLPPSVVPKAPRVPAELSTAPPPPRSDEDEDEIVAKPTIQLPAERGSQAPPPNLSQRPSQRPGGSYSYREEGGGTRPHEQDTTQPARPSKLPPPPARIEGNGSDPPPPRTLTHPPLGAGAYSVAGSEAERAGMGRRKAPSTAPPAAPAAQARSPERPQDFGGSDPRRKTVPRRRRRSDPRREKGTAAESQEVVAIPAAVHQSLKPIATDPKVREVPSIVVDLGAEAERLITELIRVGPDDDGRVLGQIVRLGESALPIVSKRFPGPLWFDRYKPRKRLPLGREISAAARVLHAFDDKAVPYVAELLASPQVEARYAATLLAADLVRPALVWPLYQRLFDPDGQVRLIATETLLVYRNVPGFAEVLKSLRERALDEQNETPQGRLSALEAIGALRDPGSAEVLVRLSGHNSRQLSVSARRSLVAITGQDFDGDRKWRAWLDKNGKRHRVEWLIEGLMHPEERVRATAAIELQKLTQVYYGFEATAGKREREQAQTRYRNWWLIEGKRAFGL